MANLLEDIQCVGSDTRPHMLDRTDFASWQQRIRLYCQGKENGVNILKSTDEGPFLMGPVQEPLAKGTEGAPHLGQARHVKCCNCKDIRHIERNCTQPKHSQNSNYYNDKMLLMHTQENRVALDEEQLLFLKGGQANIIDEDVDEQPVLDLALNVDNVFQADDYPVNDEVGPSYDSDNPSEVHDHDHYQDAACEHHEEHTMHDNVQLKHIVDSHSDYTGDSNIILYDQYVKDNAVPVVHSNVSSVPNDAYMMIYNDMYEPHAQSISKTSRNTVVKNSLTAKLATYKEQVELYERQARPKPYYNELIKVAIGYKNHLCLTRIKQVQPALYNGHEIIKDNHVPTIVHNTEDTLEIAEITRRKMNDKMTDPECVTHKVKIAPHDYSKENFLATFTPQKQLIPEQIFWNLDEIERKNLLIANDSLIVECLTKQVFSDATNFELNVARFTEIHVANTIVETRCLELEAEHSNLRDKSHNDNHDELVNHFPILRNNREAHLDYLKNLKESVETIRDIVEEAKVHSCYVRDTDGVELIKGSRRSNLYTISVEDIMKSSPICLLSKASKILENYNQQLILEYSLVMHQARKASYKSSSCSSLCTPTNNDLEILFQAMFDEYLEHPRVERSVSPAPALQAPVNSVGIPSSTTIDQDTRSPSISPSSSALQSHSLHQGITSKSTFMEDNPLLSLTIIPS
uniref:Integrase, catalytic region, zinc finger, CCHC-type, peptidase aspartic, catalytic n=1 Tax=Tanacetum cinerariifolium TaxID=118510 RepID=A0A6L2NQS7_TANCI|nr:integrase, catalytic region, zinc finger, CCHC-type, peptidase aspartic, catalytic [Tanacetum cinerariifolium]